MKKDISPKRFADAIEETTLSPEEIAYKRKTGSKCPHYVTMDRGEYQGPKTRVCYVCGHKLNQEQIEIDNWRRMAAQRRWDDEAQAIQDKEKYQNKD